jgi:hypothetical protein
MLLLKNPAGKGGVRLKAIKIKNFVLAALTGFGILTSAMLLVFGGAMSEIRARILLAGVMIMSGISTGFWMCELRKLKIARQSIRRRCQSSPNDSAMKLESYQHCCPDRQKKSRHPAAIPRIKTVGGTGYVLRKLRHTIIGKHIILPRLRQRD